MIQGEARGELQAVPTRSPVVNEAQGAVKGGLKNDAGTIAMARTSDPNSAAPRNFSSTSTTRSSIRDPRGDGNGHATGCAASGQDVVTKIAKTATDPAARSRAMCRASRCGAIEAVTLVPAQK